MSRVLIGGHRLAALVVCFALGACATFERTKPAPPQAGVVAVQVSNEQLSGWTDLPIGAYKVPQSDVVVTGHQRGAGAAMMFGLLGVAAAHAVNANGSAAGTSSIEHLLRLRLADEARTYIAEAVTAPELAAKFSPQDAQGSRLDVTTAVILTYVDDVHLRPYAVLKVALSGADRKPVWETRYFASTGVAKPLSGDDGWTAQEGAVLRANVSSSLRQAVKVMLSDVARPFPRDDKQMMVAESEFPFVQSRMQLLGYALTEDERYVAFVPKVGDVNTLSGVNVLDKSVTVYRPAKSDDPVAKTVVRNEAAPSPVPSAAASGVVAQH